MDGSLKPVYADAANEYRILNMQKDGLLLSEIAAVLGLPIEEIHRIISEWANRK